MHSRRQFKMNFLISYCWLQLVFAGLVINGKKIIEISKAKSSPSRITAAKGSSVWLHWGYNYIGDGQHSVLTTTFREQIIGFKSSSQPIFQVLARRIGQNGDLILESSLPAPFNGRVEVISSNSTLVIHDLQYTDSTYQFSSRISIDVNAGRLRKTHVYGLQNYTTLDINGIPEFIRKPPTILEVNEGSKLQLRIEMDGNPKPSVDFRWTHITGSSPINVTSVKLYSFVYSSTYSMENVDAKYCGRMLQAKIENTIGEHTQSTRVTVLLKLDYPFHLKASKIAASKCVELEWNKKESGACCVKFEVVAKDASGNVLHAREGCNIYEMKICSLKVYASVATIELTVSFKTVSKMVIKKVVEKPISTVVPVISEGTISRDSNHSNSTTTVSTENPVSNPNNETAISGLNFFLIMGLSCGIVALRIIFIGIQWCRKLTTTSASMPIRDTYRSTKDVH